MAGTIYSGSLVPIEALFADDRVVSSDGRFFLIMQGDGNLVEYANSHPPRAIWASNTDGSGAFQAVMQSDGNFVVYKAPDYDAKWASNTAQHPGSHLEIHNSGTLAIVSATGQLVLGYPQFGPPPEVVTG